MALPARDLSRNQNSAATAAAATARVRAWDSLIDRPSRRPVAALNSPALTRNRAPSENDRSSGPMMKRTTPLSTNITPVEAMRKIIGGLFRRR